jgi:hypothetical protein
VRFKILVTVGGAYSAQMVNVLKMSRVKAAGILGRRAAPQQLVGVRVIMACCNVLRPNVRGLMAHHPAGVSWKIAAIQVAHLLHQILLGARMVSSVCQG